MPTWEDVNARARGLGTHLVPPAVIDAMDQVGDLRSLADVMREAGIPVPAGPPVAATLEQAARRAAAARLATLLRWCGQRADMLAVLIEDEDRRSIRSMLRGAAQGALPEHRLAGLLPTPALPEKALAELARQPGVSAVAALLIAWRHPLAGAMRPEAFSAHPDLALLERALNRLFAVHALRAARRAGRRGALVAQVRLAIDLENALTAFSLAGSDGTITPKDLFLPGGARLDAGAYELACASGSPERAAAHLARAFTGTPLAAAITAGRLDAVALEPDLLRARIAMLQRSRARDPLGPETVIEFLLRLRLELVQLRRVIWGVALMPASAPGRAA